MKKYYIFIILMSFITTQIHSQLFGKKNQEPPTGSFVSESQFKDYIPISPMGFEQNVIVFNEFLGDYDTVSIKELATNSKNILRFLPNETVFSTLQKNDGSLEAKYGPGSLTAEAGNYTVTLDYAKFTTLKYQSKNNDCEGFTKVGVGMRITAKITTFNAGVDVSSLFGLGLAAKAGNLSGQLTIDIIGMESSQITDLITLPVDISEASIQTALQSLSAIKSKMYDQNTNLYPQILAIKKMDEGCSAFDFLEVLDKPTKSTRKPSRDSKKGN